MSIHKLIFVLLVSTFGLVACGDDSPGVVGEEDARVEEIDAGDVAGSCNFVNCDGCCDGEVCIEQTDVNSCGQAGSACQSCNGGDLCVAGSCVPAADCSDCEGCCFEGTQCLEGNTLSACGSDGNACVGCPDGQGCSDGVCETIACNETNCANGCCTANGDCVTSPEQTTDACGTGGQACNVCSASASSCTLGTCVEDQACLDFCTDGCCNVSGQCILFADQEPGVCGTNTCAPCSGDLSCVGGACTPDPVWQVIVHSAILAPLNPDGEDWDQVLFSNPLPDAYVTGALESDTFLDWFTSNINNTITPVWNEPKGSYLQSDLVAVGLQIVVRDSDGLGVFETMGSCDVVIGMSDLIAGTITVPVCGVSVTNLRLDFVQQ